MSLASRPASTVVGASVVAGIALWFSRGALDIAGSATAQQRVAALPSWPELPAWIVLMLLAAAAIALVAPDGGRAGTGARPRGVSWDPALADAFRPLAALALLALPYLPWLPDWIPPLRLLAGPLKRLVWAVVLGQVAWTLLPLLVRRRRRASPWTPGPGLASAGIFLASVAVYGAVSTRLSDSTMFPGGDEPHYLVVTQSLLYDGDLRIANNHEQGDYRQYYPGSLRPHYRTLGSDGEIYSIHPIGLPVLAVPAFAAGGYRGVVWLVILLAAGTAALLWRWAFALTGSSAAATFAWAAVGLSAPFVFSSGTVYPEIPAGFCVMVAASLLGPVRADAGRVAGVRPWLAGLALAALPWLSTKYAGMALVLAAVLALRERAHPRRAASIVLPLAVSLAGWFTFFYVYWGSPLPSAPYGNDTQMSVRTLLSGGPGNWLDQEFGVLIYAPVLALGFAGLAGLCRDRTWRAFAVELTLVLAAMCATVGSFGIWWGGSAMPGRPVISILPLLAVPIARHYQLAIAHAGRVAASRLALLISLVTTAALAIVAGGRLLAQGRDGISAWLEWLSPVWHLWASAPTFIFSPPLAASGQALCWLGGALIVAALCRRGVSAAVETGRAARRATLAAAVVSIAVAAVVPAISSAGAPGRFDPEARSFFPMLGRFDAVARPLGVRYDPLSVVPPSAIPPLFTLTAAPGQRLAPQPLEVMLNARFMLPAGEYELELTGVRGQGLPEGEIGLQIGREGDPIERWPSATPAGRPFRRRFHVPLDAEFVGFRAPPEVARATGGLTLTPLAVVDAGRRAAAGTVLSALPLGAATVFFHDSNAYPEPGGFWVRGGSTTEATFMKDPAGDRDLVLDVHTGANPNRILISTPSWAEQIDLVPYATRTVVVPSRSADRFVSVHITSRGGFVPAEVGPGSTDTRRLGCWVAIGSAPA